MSNKIKREPDYTLNVFHHYDAHKNKNVIVFLVQTTKIFISFKYEILLEDTISDHGINLKITGLHVPELLMPQTGPAQGRRDYNIPEGTYKLVIIKQDNTLNEFLLNISSATIDVLKKPRIPFILISNEPINLS